MSVHVCLMHICIFVNKWLFDVKLKRVHFEKSYNQS